MKTMRILTGVFSAVFASLLFIYNIINIVMTISDYAEYDFDYFGGYVTMQVVSLIVSAIIILVLYATLISFAFLSKKSKALAFPTMMIAIYLGLTVIFSMVTHIIGYGTSFGLVFTIVITVMAALPTMVLSIVYCSMVRPFAKEQANFEEKRVVVEKPRTSSGSAYDEILKAKQLLDAGALTEEEFKAIKTKLL